MAKPMGDLGKEPTHETTPDRPHCGWNLSVDFARVGSRASTYDLQPELRGGSSADSPQPQAGRESHSVHRHDCLSGARFGDPPGPRGSANLADSRAELPGR